jgi:hypothetical protein
MASGFEGIRPKVPRAQTSSISLQTFSVSRKETLKSALVGQSPAQPCYLRTRPQSVACDLAGLKESRLRQISASYIQFQIMRLVVNLFLTWRSLSGQLFLLRFGG